jgi:hypothetical protein
VTLYALVVNDRHRDIEVRLFTDPQRASAELIDLARDNEWEIDVPTPDGWIVSCHNERESDNAHVVAVEVEQ